jgi:poly-gamma-glutamate capsule biosynthesis protein CapA/YwtB (metallophosphatase superfamily)
MDRRTFLKHVARASAVAGAAGAAGWPAATGATLSGPGTGTASPAGSSAGVGSETPPGAGSVGAPVAPGTEALAGAAGATATARPSDRFTLVAAGDCIITRRVRDVADPDFLAVVELVRGADCAWGNCEIVVGKGGELYPAFKGLDPHAIGDLWTADELRWMGFRLMGTANNHTLDYGNEGLVSTCENLDRVGIAHAGSGLDLEEAARPGFADTGAGRVGLVSCASSFPGFFAAGPTHPYVKGRPGINPLNVKSKVVLDRATFKRMAAARKALGELWGEGDYQGLDIPTPPPDAKTFDFGEMTVVAGDHTDYLSEADPGDRKRIVEALAVARGGSRVVIASIHSHEARRKFEISDLFLQPFARAAIDAGADVFVASGPHVLRGIEIYKGKPIFYSLANFFFQLDTERYVPAEDFAAEGLDSRTLDPMAFERKIGFHKQRRFWQSVLPRVTFDGGSVTAVELFPLALGFGEPAYRAGTPRLARGAEATAILGQLASLSAPYGTGIEIRDGVGRVRLG